MTKGGESNVSFCYLRDLRTSPQTYRKRGGAICNLVFVECLQMINSMVVGFCSIRGWCNSG